MVTDEQIDAMEAGHEIDQLVADATGETDDSRAEYLGFHGGESKHFDRRVRFGYSRSWDFALHAAERFNLFDMENQDERGSKLLYFTRGNWVVTDSWHPRRGPDGTAQSGPLAICRAILKCHSRRKN